MLNFVYHVFHVFTTSMSFGRAHLDKIGAVCHGQLQAKPHHSWRPQCLTSTRQIPVYENQHQVCNSQHLACLLSIVWQSGLKWRQGFYCCPLSVCQPPAVWGGIHEAGNCDIAAITAWAIAREALALFQIIFEPSGIYSMYAQLYNLYKQARAW